MEKTEKPSGWEKFLDFMGTTSAFLVAIGGPIATALAWRSVIKCNTEAQIQLIQAQDASWLMRQQYFNQRAHGTQN